MMRGAPAELKLRKAIEVFSATFSDDGGTFVLSAVSATAYRQALLLTT